MSVLHVVAASAAIGVAGLIRQLRERAVHREYTSRFPFDESGIASGAAGFTLSSSSGRGLLMLHGSGDTPQSVRYVAERLNAAGFAVHVPLLPGHGRSPREFAVATAADYHRAASLALTELKASQAWVGLVGLSMGGAIAVRLATEHDVQALVLLAPYLRAPARVRVVRATSSVWSLWTKYLRGHGPRSVHDPVARAKARAYGTFSAGALDALVSTADAGYRALEHITVPTLVINSDDDNRIPRAMAEDAMERIRAPLERHWVSGCGHVITVDYCKDSVAARILAFLAGHAGRAGATRRG